MIFLVPSEIHYVQLLCILLDVCKLLLQSTNHVLSRFVVHVTGDFNTFTVTKYQHPSVPDHYIIDVLMVEKQLAKINTRKAVGPVGIPNWLLRDVSACLAAPVCSLGNAGIKDGYFPPVWKLADVVPLPNVTPTTRIHKNI